MSATPTILHNAGSVSALPGTPRFYVGTHHVHWLWMQRFFPTQFSLFISHRRLVGRKWLHGGPFRAAAPWALDSGGFTELSLHGEWKTTPESYVAAIRTYAARVGMPDFAAPQDWMCEPFMIQRTGLSVYDHQRRTVANLLRLRELAPDLPIIPVLQGWRMADYLQCLDMYADAGIDLAREPLVGLGSVCRRQSTDDIAEIVTTLADLGLRLHGFGVKTAGLARYGHALASADCLVVYPVRSCWWMLIFTLPLVRTAYEPGGWVVFRYELERPQGTVDDPLLVAHAELLNGLAGRGRRRGQPFLIGPDGRPDDRVNAFFASPQMLSRSPLTWKKYAQSLGMWLNFLLVLGRRWDEATEDDAEYFKEWRLSEQSNPQLVEASTFAANLAGLRKFYRWAARRYGVADPVTAMDDFDLKPRGVRGQDVKWLDPAGYRRWRDLGIRGLGLDGRPDGLWRGRNEQRDAAFVDGLYSSGLRLTEWASVLITDLPDDNPARGYRTCRLADSGNRGV